MRFIISTTKEPHSLRRFKILNKYPNIKQFFGIEKKTKYIALGLIIFQIVSAIYSVNLSWKLWIFCLYFLNASISQTLFLINHEVAHDLAFKNRISNNILGYLVNLPAIFPYSAAFRHYHLMHHKYLGTKNLDMDIPTDFEAKIMQSIVGRIFWLTFQIFTYALRPIIVNPTTITRPIFINIVVQISFDILFYYKFGLKPIGYLLLSLLIAGSWHPTASHFISEHTNFSNEEPELDTFDLNGLHFFTLNVNYHRIHHDFTKIPWSKLPAAQALALEYYPMTKKTWYNIFKEFLLGNPSRIIRDNSKIHID